MKNLLKEISVIPGVWATCIFDRQEGVVCAESDAGFPRDQTEQVALHFVRLVQMAGMNKLSIKSTHFRFDRYSVVCLPLEKGAVLLVICDSQANCSLVATTAVMLVEDIRIGLDKPVSSPPSGNPDVLRGGGGVAGNDAVELEPSLREIEDAFVAAIGPAAGMIMNEYAGRWRANGSADTSRLVELINMLAEKIGDAGLSAEFRSRLKHLF